MEFIKSIIKKITIILGNKKHYEKVDWEYTPLSENEKNMMHSFGEALLKAAEEFHQDNSTKKEI